MTYTSLNPRFCAFAHSHGMSGEAMQARGFRPSDFMAFVRAELNEFCRQKGRQDIRLGDKLDHEAFTAFLLARYPEVAA